MKTLPLKAPPHALQHSCRCNNAGQDCPVLRAVGHAPVIFKSYTTPKQQLMGSEPGHLQVHQDPSSLIPELLQQLELDSPEEGLHQLFFFWKRQRYHVCFNTMISSYAYALGR